MSCYEYSAKKMKILSPILSFLGKGLRYARARIWRQQVYIVFAKRIGGAAKPITPKMRGIVFSRVEDLAREHFQRLSSINRYLTLSDFNKDVNAGHECFVGKQEDTNEVVFYVWTRQRSSHELEAGMHPAYTVSDPKEIHFFSAFTSVAYRGNNIYPAGVSYLERYYGERGYGKLSCSVATTNEPSLNGIRKLDFVPTKYRIVETTRFFHEARKISLSDGNV